MIPAPTPSVVCLIAGVPLIILAFLRMNVASPRNNYGFEACCSPLLGDVAVIKAERCCNSRSRRLGRFQPLLLAGGTTCLKPFRSCQKLSCDDICRTRAGGCGGLVNVRWWLISNLKNGDWLGSDGSQGKSAGCECARVLSTGVATPPASIMYLDDKMARRTVDDACAYLR